MSQIIFLVLYHPIITLPKQLYTTQALQLPMALFLEQFTDVFFDPISYAIFIL